MDQTSEINLDDLYKRLLESINKTYKKSMNNIKKSSELICAKHGGIILGSHYKFELIAIPKIFILICSDCCAHDEKNDASDKCYSCFRSGKTNPLLPTLIGYDMLDVESIDKGRFWICCNCNPDVIKKYKVTKIK